MNRYKNIRAIVMDIDGVLTDGSLIPTSDGDLMRIFNAKDSFAMRSAISKGYIVGIISGGDCQSLRIRMGNYGMDPKNVHLGCRGGKLPVFRQFCSDNGVSPDQVMYFGDDVPDVPLIEACGLGIAPADACPEARKAADIVSVCPGGKCCVRTEIEKMMRSLGLWDFEYKDLF